MIEFVAIVVCVLLNALLAGSEMAFIAADRLRLKELCQDGNKDAKLLLQLRENPEQILSLIQLGITFVGAMAAAFGGAVAWQSIVPSIVAHFEISVVIAEVLAILFVVIPLTYMSVVFGELVPKAFSLRRPVFVACKVAPWLHLLCKVLEPIVAIFERTTKKILRFFPEKHVFKEAPMSSEGATDLKKLSPENKEYVLNIIKIEKTAIEEVMTDWSEVVFVDVNQSMDAVDDSIVTSGHTRLPVVKDGKVIGVINSKEFLALKKTSLTNWTSLIHKAIFFDKHTLLFPALRKMQEDHGHMAIVMSQDKQIGMITIEAIFEEVVGNIYDEDDDGSIQKILQYRVR